MSIKPPSKSDMLNWIDDVDSNLQKITYYLDTVFYDIESCPQEVVDYLCEKASDWASYGLEYAKVKVLNGLAAQKKSAEDMIKDYGELSAALIGASTPPFTLPTLIIWAASMITLVKKMYEIIIKPYKEALEFIIELTNKIISISTSMQQIASWRPPQAPDINFNKFNIKFTPFSIGDIQENIPYPEPPEPKPFPNPFEDTIALARATRKGKLSGGESNTSNIA